jgi:hypothetical protein
MAACSLLVARGDFSSLTIGMKLHRQDLIRHAGFIPRVKIFPRGVIQLTLTGDYGKARYTIAIDAVPDDQVFCVEILDKQVTDAGCGH